MGSANGLERESPRLNTVHGINGPETLNTFATRNPYKQREIGRILGDEGVIFIDELKVDEIQSPDPYEVVSKKAIEAYRANGYFPVIIEDVSLTIHAIEQSFSSPYVNLWAKTTQARQFICDSLKDDRRATARTIYAVYDGGKVHLREGKTEGVISRILRGNHGFGWDDFFIPDGADRTFAEMVDDEKDLYSMRRKGLEAILAEPFPIEQHIFQMEEPNHDEIPRIRMEELTGNPAALNFAFALEALAGIEPNIELDANRYQPIIKVDAKDDSGVKYYVRYTVNPESPSLGLILTDISKARVVVGPNNEPFLYQMGPEARKLALAQRIDFFQKNQNNDIHAALDRLEQDNDIPHRPNRQHKAIEDALGVKQSLARRIVMGLNTIAPAKLKDFFLPRWKASKTISWDDLAYRKQSSDQIVSRRPDVSDYIFNKIGKYYRRPIGGGSMPVSTGSRDELVMSALGHMVSFIPRNSRFVDINEQVKLAQEARNVIGGLDIPNKWKERAYHNIGASLGIDDPEKVIADARRLYEEGGVRLFRIYTIGADPRIVEVARRLRQEFGDEIEIFAGQVADKKEAKQLIAPDIRVDAIVFGHGGGRQCTSGKNRMAITTVEEIYEIITDPEFNDVSLLVEGGVGSNSSAFILGVDGVLYNNRLVHGTIESPAGDIYVRDAKTKKYVQPYPGSASAETQLIESIFEEIRERRTNAAGRISTEGSPGHMLYERKAGGSMAFWINELLSDISKMYADLGVKNIKELRQKVARDPREFIRIVSANAQQVATAYKV